MPYKDPQKQREYHRIYMNKRREKRKIKAIEFKGGKCKNCGYNKCLGVMHFHHRNPSKKEFQISRKDVSWNLIKKELDKCDLLCANCHNELEYEKR